MFGFNAINGAVSGVGAIEDDNNRKKLYEQQPQVAFINTIFEGYGNNNSGSEAAFNA